MLKSQCHKIPKYKNLNEEEEEEKENADLIFFLNIQSVKKRK